MKGAQFNLKNGVPLGELRLSKHDIRAVGANGELNASSRKDLFSQIGRLMVEASAGKVEASDVVSKTDEVKQRQQLVASMQNDPTVAGQVGIALAAEISETAARDGFLRNLVIEEPLTGGQRPQIRTRYKNVHAIVASGASTLAPQLVRDKYAHPAEFYIESNIEIEQREINQATGDILDEKYKEGLEAFMVEEDRMWKRGADQTVGLANTLTTIGSTLTPGIFAAIRELITDWNLPAVSSLIANDFWKDISTNSAWLTQFDEVTKAEILMTGTLGSFLGVQIKTDGFRPPEQKVLNRGELYIISAPEHHGAITTRGGIRATPINGALHGRPTQGWYMVEDLSFMITNARSVAKGSR